MSIANLFLPGIKPNTNLVVNSITLGSSEYDGVNAISIEEAPIKLGILSEVEKNALPAENGMLLYDNTANAFSGYANGSWTQFTGGGSGGAPTDATYILKTNNSDLPNAQVLASLSTGLLKSSQVSGQLSTAVPGTDYLVSIPDPLPIGKIQANGPVGLTISGDQPGVTDPAGNGPLLLASTSNEPMTFNAPNTTIVFTCQGTVISDLLTTNIIHQGIGINIDAGTEYCTFIAGTLDFTGTFLSRSGITTIGFLNIQNPSRNQISVIAPTAAFTNYSLTLPSNNGTNGQVLSNDGNGITQWIDVGSGIPDPLIINQLNVDTIMTKSPGDLTVTAPHMKLNGELGILNSYGNQVNIVAPPATFTNYSLTLPSNSGDSGDVLITDGSGVMSWTDSPTFYQAHATFGFTSPGISLTTDSTYAIKFVLVPDNGQTSGNIVMHFPPDIPAANQFLMTTTGGGNFLTTWTNAVQLNSTTGQQTYGNATLSSGAVTVSTTFVTAGSIIMLSRVTLGTGTPGHLSYTITAGTSFTITSSEGSDNGTISYLIMN